MQQYNRPDKSRWEELLQRPKMDTTDLFESVKSVLTLIQAEGDEAVRRYSAKFDGFTDVNFIVDSSEIEESTMLISTELKEAIQTAANNISTFHKSQQQTFTKVETQPGVVCWQKSVGIEKVGLYVPGGTAPLFSTVLMLAIPAKIAIAKNALHHRGIKSAGITEGRNIKRTGNHAGTATDAHILVVNYRPFRSLCVGVDKTAGQTGWLQAVVALNLAKQRVVAARDVVAVDKIGRAHV